MKTQYDAVDAMKFVCACMIVIMHSAFLAPNVYLNILPWPWVRVAVPLFFIMSSWLFFRRGADWMKYLCFVKRNMLLYLIWGIVSIPFIPTRSIGCFLHDFFLSGIWGPTWFIMALVIGIGVIKIIASFSEKLLFCVALALFLISYFTSSLLPLMSDCVRNIAGNYMNLISRPYQSFPIGIAWCSIGYAIARCEKESASYLIKAKGIAILSAVALFIEWVTLYIFTGERCNDVYFMLLPLSASIFCLIKNSVKSIKNAIFLRKASVVIFITHIQVISILRPFLSRYDYLNILRCVLPIVIGCFMASILIRLERVNGLKWLHYAY